METLTNARRESELLQFNTQQALYAAIQLVKWASQQQEAGLELRTLCATMVTVGAAMGVAPEELREYRTKWAHWLRSIAEDIEAGRSIGPIVEF